MMDVRRKKNTRPYSCRVLKDTPVAEHDFHILYTSRPNPNIRAKAPYVCRSKMQRMGQSLTAYICDYGLA